MIKLILLAGFMFLNGPFSKAQHINRYSVSLLPSMNKDYSFGKNMFDTDAGTKTVVGYEFGYNRILKNKMILYTGLGYANSGYKVYSQPIDNVQRKEVFYSEYSTPSIYVPIRLGYEYKFIEACLGTNIRYDFKTKVYKSQIGAYYTEGEDGIFNERGALGFDFAVYATIMKNSDSQLQFGPYINTISFTSNNNIATYGLAVKYSMVKLKQ